MPLDHIEVFSDNRLPYRKGFVMHDAKQVLNLLVRERQLAISHLDPVVARVEMTAGDHDAGADSVVRCRGEINSRREHLANVGYRQTGGCQAFNDGCLERTRSDAIVRADKYALRLKVPGQIGAQGFANQQRHSRRQLRRAAGRDSTDIVLAKNRGIDCGHLSL